MSPENNLVPGDTQDPVVEHIKSKMNEGWTMKSHEIVVPKVFTPKGPRKLIKVLYQAPDGTETYHEYNYNMIKRKMESEA